MFGESLSTIEASLSEMFLARSVLYWRVWGEPSTVTGWDFHRRSTFLGGGNVGAELVLDHSTSPCLSKEVAVESGFLPSLHVLQGTGPGQP